MKSHFSRKAGDKHGGNQPSQSPFFAAIKWGLSLFNPVSRERKKNANDADRLRKYLAGFGIDWKDVMQRQPDVL